MLNTNLSPWPLFSQAERDAVAEVLNSGRVNYWTGEEGRAFEREFAAWAGAAHAVALANGTLALDIALKALGIGPGDEVVVTPRTFIASVSCVVNAGAVPVFADVDRDSGNITPQSAERVLTSRSRAIIPVHLAGWPCDMEGFTALAGANDLHIIEDCAQAHGARHRGRSVGTFGAVGAWSFCQDKIMTTGGEGGMVTTDRDDLFEAMWSYKDHGKDRRKANGRHGGGFRWVHDGFGTNWRMLEMQAAIGRVQLGLLPEWTAARTRNALALHAVAARHAAVIRAPLPDPRDNHAYYRFYAYLRPDGLKAGWDRDRIVARLVELGAPAYQGSCAEVYLEKAFDGTGWRPEAPLPVAHELGQTSLMFLTHPSITAEDLEKVCGALDAVLIEAAR